MQSHPLCRMHFDQSLASSALLGWQGDGDCYLIVRWLSMHANMHTCSIWRWNRILSGNKIHLWKWITLTLSSFAGLHFLTALWLWLVEASRFFLLTIACSELSISVGWEWETKQRDAFNFHITNFHSWIAIYTQNQQWSGLFTISWMLVML